MAAHRYWRLHCTAQNGASGNLVCAESEFRNSSGGADLTGSGTAIASTQSGGAASNAFDNNSTTNWIASSGIIAGPWWLGYDFGAGNAFAIVEITWRSRSTRFDFMPTTFSIQYSDDGTNWTTAWTGTWTWTSNGQINTTTDPGAGATAGRPLTFAPT